MEMNANGSAAAARKRSRWAGMLSWFDNERAVTDTPGSAGARRIGAASA
jgi:hypothetical protein